MNPVAVIFHRLGPYHFARLRAAGQLLQVTAIETSGADETYAWDLVAGADGFERVTLFGNADAKQQPAREVASRMGSALEKISPSVVAIPGWSDAAALAALQWCGRRQVPAIVMSESTEWDEARSAWREAVKRRIVGLFSAALVGGKPHKEYMVKLGMPAERVFLGYDAVDNGYFEDKVREARSAKCGVRSKDGLPEKYFLASARFIEKKNLPRLLQAYARYRELCAKRQAPSALSEAESWHLVLLGGGPLHESLCALRSALGLDACVHLPGFKQYSDLPAYYGLACAFIHASTTEQWGLVVNEAMASGLPVLVSNRCGCAPDLVQEGVNGFTFDPYDAGQLAQLMIRISDFRFPISGFGAASQRIISNWGPQRFVQGLKATVECALKVGHKHASMLDRILLAAMMRR